MRTAYRAALVCGAAPLLLGTAIFALWLATRWEWLMAAGAFTLFGGLACFGVGVLALARFCWLGLRDGDPPPRFWTAAVLAAVLLLSNFPAAGLILRKAIEIETTYTVVVRNESGKALDGVRIVGRGRVYAALDTLAPGATATRSFRIAHEGPLDLEVSGETTTIDSYVTTSEGATAFVTIRPDGSASVGFAPSDD